jgi:soluble lytic murein transglycosylase-like protein
MKWILITLLLLPSSVMAWEHRLDEEGYERTSELLPIITYASKQAGVPQWLLVGLIYNESNSNHKVIGDSGRAYGLGQIHCGNGGFSWLNFLDDRGFKKCSDLLSAEKNIIAISLILSYLKKKMKNPKDYLLLLTYYHKGENYRRRGKKKSRNYYARVKWFGVKILEREQQLCLGTL